MYYKESLMFSEFISGYLVFILQMAGPDINNYFPNKNKK